MPNLSDSCRVDRLPVSVRKLARDAGMSFPLSLRAFLRDAPCPHTECVTLHLKSLSEPNVPVRTMLVSMRTVYNTANVGVRVGSREDLGGNAFAMLRDLDTGTCIMGGTPTAEQTTLFANRNNVGINDIVIYFVRTTNPGSNGCANHPTGRPGAVVTRGATQWTLAHEIGHVLGLRHVDDPPPPNPGAPSPLLDRLMTGRGTASITNPPPDLINTEVTTMRSSPLT
ncbi:hypothetical protein [Streptosporangium lutulentum]|uniref:Uncharacterized protein n=1 Tax=Streptosporangium lutulentum TaxID=1461250 RepID=A0ABT9Q3H8_9ACTN|nr:hypothetical protein [Streptosporangium lutulentum]MDP9841010.1 hypothetical protein [Streptosporangium lutulentum]